MKLSGHCENTICDKCPGYTWDFRGRRIRCECKCHQLEEESYVGC